MSGALFQVDRIVRACEHTAAKLDDDTVAALLVECATHLRSLGQDNDRLRGIMAKRAGVLGTRPKRPCPNPGTWTPERRALLQPYVTGKVPYGTAGVLLARVNALPGRPIASALSLRVTLSRMRRAARAAQ
jgi:hypothetical protein